MSLASKCMSRIPSTGSCELEQPAFAVTNEVMPLAVVIMAEARSGLWTRLTERLVSLASGASIYKLHWNSCESWWI